MDKKKTLSVVGGLLIAAVVIVGIALLISRQGSKSAPPQPLVQEFATPTLGVPTATEVPVPGNNWKFISLEKHVIHQNGYWYDVGTFQNVDRPDITVRAMCMAPRWPAPEIGAIYALNDYGILYPVVDNATSNLQRFMVLK